MTQSYLADIVFLARERAQGHEKRPKCQSENTDTARFCSNCAAPLGSSREIAFSKTMTVQKPREVLAGGRILAGKYQIIEPIGRGGMGVVYRADDLKLERTVALKFLPSELTEDSEARERFVREAKAAALSHNHICTVFEIGEEENQLFIAMQYIQGESLKQKISKGPLDQTETLRIVIQVAEALGESQRKGIVHRDVKPGNIMVTDEGTAKVMDFGLAKALGRSLITKEAKTMGTVAYRSPEQAGGGPIDHRTDIWSLGVVFYEMLTGQLPFKGEYEQSIIHSILNREPEPITRIRKDFPLGLEHVIGKALEKTPADRYQSMEELLGDLKAIAEGLKPLRAKPGLFRGRILGLKKVYAYAGLACLVTLAALAIILLVPKRGQAYDSIAVLPLENISGNPEQEAFCDGVQQELITQLSRVKAIKKVIAKSSVMEYKGTKKKNSEIARELKVAALVAGGANRSGNKVRINFEIIDGQSDKLIGGDHFDGEYKDILALQSEAALAIAQKIQASLTPEETRILARKRPINPEAYEAYQNGMFIIGRGGVYSGDKSDPNASIQNFERALKIEPEFAPAYAGLALAYDFYSFVISPDEAWPKAKEAALNAISLDDSVADAYFVLADMKTCYEWDWEGGEKAWTRALEVNPNHALAHAVYANVLAGQERNEEAVAHADRARELDPRTVITLVYVLGAYQNTRQYDRGITLAEESLGLFPNNTQLYQNLINLYALRGMSKEAIAAGLKYKDLRGSFAGVGIPLARAYGLEGRLIKGAGSLELRYKNGQREIHDRPLGSLPVGSYHGLCRARRKGQSFRMSGLVVPTKAPQYIRLEVQSFPGQPAFRSPFHGAAKKSRIGKIKLRLLRSARKDNFLSAKSGNLIAVDIRSSNANNGENIRTKGLES